MSYRIDELNLIRSYLLEGKPDEAIDEILEMLEMAFYRGANKAYDDLGIFRNREIPNDFERILNERIADKTTEERVLEYIETGDVEALLRVADTEYTRILNESALGVAIANGATTKKWVTRKDDRVREQHEYLEGQVIGINDKFYTHDGDSAMYPGDFMMAENNCNCRCELEFK